MTAIQLSTAYRPVNCCRCGCGFALPDGFVRARREDHKAFFCPNGHANHFPQQTEEERLRADLEWAERRAANAAKRADNIAEQRDAERRRSAALKGVVTRTKNRIAKGVCPCCNRTFSDLARHMESKHPDYAGKE